MAAIAYPFKRLFGDIVLSITSVIIDGDEVPDLYIDRDLRSVNIFAINRDEWTECEVNARVELPIQEIRSEGLDESKLQVMLRFNCDETKLRITELPNLIDGCGEAKVTIHRRAMSGSANFEAFAVYDGSDKIPRILKEAVKWKLLFTRPTSQEHFPGRRRTRVREFVQIRWINFGASDHGFELLRDFQSEAHFIDVSSNPPVLYLNEGLAGYRVLLTERRGASSSEVALRDLEYRRLAMSVWLAATYQSLSKLTVEDDGEVQMPTDWSGNVIERIVKEMYPADPFAAGVRKLVEMREGDSSGGYLNGLIQIAISRIIGSAASLRKHLSRMLQVI